MRRMSGGSLVCVVLLLSLLGCEKDDSLHFTDDLGGFSLRLGIWGTPDDDLHQPYVQGAAVSIWMHMLDGNRNVAGAVPVSTDETVFEIVSSWSSHDTVFVEGFARGNGSAELVIYDSEALTDVIAEAPLAVQSPDAIELHPASSELLDLPSDPVDLEGGLQIAVGGTATFLVRYMHEGTRLFGNNILEPNAVGSGVSVETRQTHLFENDEWLQITVNESGLQQVELIPTEEGVQSLWLEGVSRDKVVDFDLVGQSESKAHAGQILRVLAEAKDADGNRVHGVASGWTLENSPIGGCGDLYQYTHDPDAEPVRLAAFAVGLEGSMDIRQSDGSLADSNRLLGCSSRTGPSGSAWMVLCITGLAVMAMRSRSSS